MYDFETETEIAAAVAKKACQDLGQSPSKAYNQTLQRRALKFLQEIRERINTLSNKEIANLLTVLLAAGLSIEDEEELEYWINLLESMAFSRLTLLLNTQDNSYNKNFYPDEIEGFRLLIPILTSIHQKKMPDKSEKTKFDEWSKIMQNLERAKQAVDHSKASYTSPSKSQSRHHNRQNPLQELHNKMEAAGVARDSNYWNETIASFESDIDKDNFVKNWVADQSKIDADKTKNLRRDELSDEKLKEEARSHFSNPKNQKQAEKITKQHGENINPALLKMLVISDKSK